MFSDLLLSRAVGEGNIFTGKTADDSPSDKMSNILSRTLNDSADDPDDRCDHQRIATTEMVSNPTGCDGTSERSGGHRRSNLPFVNSARFSLR
jgi:hypothetical protein